MPMDGIDQGKERASRIANLVGRGSRKTAGPNEASGIQPENKHHWALKRAEPWSSAGHGSAHQSAEQMVWRQNSGSSEKRVAPFGSLALPNLAFGDPGRGPADC